MLHVVRPKTREEFEEYFELRWRILRAPWNQPRGTEQDAFDEDADHASVRDDSGRLLGVGRLHLNSSREAQIRYMATDEASRHQGVGRTVVEELERLAAAHGVERIVLNARDSVVGFYERLGYQTIGAGPIMFGEIRHVKMEKKIG